jgi:anthranilate 1,2-dioxygenase large subunit
METTIAEGVIPPVHWPRTDYSRIPYWLYHSREIYSAEQERVFKGPIWSYVGLEAEMPEIGDFRTTYIGDTPIVVDRAQDGSIHAFVNRCAHRGALVCRDLQGNTKSHVCIYHRWSYGLDGRLEGLPFRRGLKGVGGMSPDFNLADHGLQRLNVRTYRGLIFASFCHELETFEDYMGPRIMAHLDRLFSKPIRVLGYQRQRVFGNWKFYPENTRDTYHGSLLHEFQSTFGLSRVTQTGGVSMDARHRHNLTWSKVGTDDNEKFGALYKENKVHESSLKLLHTDLVQFRPEFDDGVSLAICSIFPSLTIHQISNSIGTRLVRPVGQGEFEIIFTLLGYEDDTEEMTEHRLAQANFVGPAGLVSMEDGEAIEITHRASLADQHAFSVIEMGGSGAISDTTHRVTDVSVRGFWSYYAELMDIEPEGGIR